MTRRFSIGWLVVGVMLCAPVTLARAQTSSIGRPSDVALAVAQSEHRAGVDAFARGDYRQAIQHFSVAAERVPEIAAFSFNIARAYEALGETSLALAFYRDYARRTDDASDAQVRARVRALAKQLASRGLQQLTVSSSPKHAEAFIDGEPVGRSPITLDLAPGPHEIRLMLAGYESASRRIALASEQPSDVEFELTAAVRPASGAGLVAERATSAGASHAAEAPGAAVIATSLPEDSQLRVFGAVGLGASAAALIGALTFELLRAQTESRARRETEQTYFADELQRARTQQTLSRVFAVSGIAFAAIGGGLLWAANRTTEHDAGQRLALGCQPTQCQASMSGVF